MRQHQGANLRRGFPTTSRRAAWWLLGDHGASMTSRVPSSRWIVKTVPRKQGLSLLIALAKSSRRAGSRGGAPRYGARGSDVRGAHGQGEGRLEPLGSLHPDRGMVGARLALTDGSGPHLSWPPLSCGSEIYGSGTRDRTTDSPDVISRTGRRSRRRAQPGASPVTRQANCQYRAVRTSGHRTPSSPGNEKVGLTSAMWCQKAQTQPSRCILNYVYTAYLCGIREGDRRGSNPRPSEPQSEVIGFWALPHVAKLA
jgi:hypothetical protein